MKDSLAYSDASAYVRRRAANAVSKALASKPVRILEALRPTPLHAVVGAGVSPRAAMPATVVRCAHYIGVDMASLEHLEDCHIAVLIPLEVIDELTAIDRRHLDIVAKHGGASLFYRQRDSRGRSAPVYLVRAPWVRDGAPEAIESLLRLTGIVVRRVTV